MSIKESKNYTIGQCESVCDAISCYYYDSKRFDAIFLINNEELNIVHNVNVMELDCWFDDEENIYHYYVNVDTKIMESLIAYLNNQEYIINVDTNQIAQLSVFEYVDGNDKFELIIDTSKGVYLINKVDFNYQQRIPSYIIIKIIESLKKAGFKQVKICEEE